MRKKKSYRHDSYGKNLLRKIAGEKFHSKGKEIEVDAYKYKRARIDGVLANVCAVEIESRTPKQIRGAVVDLFFHRARKKLLILVPANLGDKPKAVEEHCEQLLTDLLKLKKKPRKDAAVILLKGTDKNRKVNEDRRIIESALRDLRCI